MTEYERYLELRANRKAYDESDESVEFRRLNQKFNPMLGGSPPK